MALTYRERHEKLVRVLNSFGALQAEHLATYILKMGFDYVPYVAAESAARAIKHYENSLEDFAKGEKYLK